MKNCSSENSDFPFCDQLTELFLLGLLNVVSFSFIYLYLKRLREEGEGWGLRGYWKVRGEEGEGSKC